MCSPKIANHTCKVILEVEYLISNSVPSNSSVLFEVVGEAQHLHAIVIKRVWFGQVYYVKPYFHVFAGVANSEEVPLCMTVRVDIITQN